MRNNIGLFAGVLLLMGFATLGTALFWNAALPKAFLVYLTSNPASFSHDILAVDFKGVYLLSVIEIALGAAGLWYQSKQ